jgi:hypothetical protein
MEDYYLNLYVYIYIDIYIYAYIVYRAARSEEGGGFSIITHVERGWGRVCPCQHAPAAILPWRAYMTVKASTLHLPSDMSGDSSSPHGVLSVLMW